MDRLEQLKTKYASALAAIEQNGVNLQNLHVQDDKLFIKGWAPNDAAKNHVWTAIKAVDAKYADLTADISVDPSLPQPTLPISDEPKTYTVQPGDTLSKISKQVYGDANKYMRIFEANTDQLTSPDMIKPGQALKIPKA